MGEIRFVLKEPKADKKTLIFLIYRSHDRRLKYSTGESTYPSLWDSEHHKVMNPPKASPTLKNEHNAINIKLNRFIAVIESSLTDFKKKEGNPDLLEYLKNELDDEFKVNKKIKNRPLTFLEYISEYIESSTKTEGSKKSNRVTLRHLLEYKAARRKKLDYDDINLDFYDDFIKYMKEKTYTEKSKDKSKPDKPIIKHYSLNSIGGHIKNIKVFMHHAADRGLHSNKDYINKRFKVMVEKTETIYLNDAELQKLYELDLSRDKRLDRVRDLFLVACWTGVRFSDLKQITPENITDKGQYIRLKIIKTGELIVIPLHWTVKEILKKYDNDIPRVISNQKMNKYLKELGKVAGINDNVRISKTNGGFRVNSNFKKYELISVHTARRSFATNMYLQDIPSISIMKITGHQTEKAFLTYIKISQEDNAKKLSQHQYFIKPLRVAN